MGVALNRIYIWDRNRVREIIKRLLKRPIPTHVFKLGLPINREDLGLRQSTATGLLLKSVPGIRSSALQPKFIDEVNWISVDIGIDVSVNL